MKETLKNYFIPHEGNGHRPRFFAGENTIFVISTALFLEILFLVNIFWILPRTDYVATILPGVVVNLTNRSRAESGESALKTNSVLARAAQMKAEDMARRGYFSHTGPGGEEPWAWFDRAGYEFSHAGENLAINFVDSEDVVRAWMRSETHKQNILNGSFSEIGIGVAKGEYEGRDAIFVVQFFGTPKASAAVRQEKPSPSRAVPVAALPQKTNTPEISEVQSLLAKILSEPHAFVTGIYALIITMIVLAMFLMVFIRVKVQHPRLVLNGAAMLIMVGSLIVLNHYLLLSQVKLF